MRVDGTSAVVTGGASGLGEATVRALVAAGSEVTFLDLNEERGEALAKELDPAHFVLANVTDDDAVAGAIHSAAEGAPLRVLVNCAGIGAGIRTIDKTGKPHSRKVWNRVIDVNLLATFFSMTLAASAMAQTEPVDDDGQRGVIINTASVAAFDGQIGQLAYAASKAAVVGMTLPAARDLALWGIRICTIAPGLFDTPLLGKLPESAKKALGDSVVQPKRLGHPSEFAEQVLSIIRTDYLNGETIRLDGGIRMQPQ